MMRRHALARTMQSGVNATARSSNDTIALGSAVVSTAVFGVSPKKSTLCERTPDVDLSIGKGLAGETPARATETVALPIPTESLLRPQDSARQTPQAKNRTKSIFALALCLTISNFGRADTATPEEILQVGSSTIHMSLAANLPLPRPVVIEWVRRAAVAVTNYLDRYPVKELSLVIERGGHGAVNDGLTHGAERIEVHLGRRTKAADLERDWVLTHEMFHLAFPTLKDRYLWMMEGLSDYLEPVARARAGQLTPQKVWGEFVEGLPQGLPAEGDRGLDNTFTRERIYWGGNLFWLLADVQIREKTNNRHDLGDAIRAILNAGGDGDAIWSLEKVLKVGDKATHTTVLKDLHDELGPKPGDVNLDALWKKLGVKYNNGTITFDNTAPDASIRIAITARQTGI